MRCLIACLALLAACAHAPVPRWRDPSPHELRRVTVAQGVTLEVADWGGTGPTLVLLAGLGNTLHIYDDLAPAFTDRAHVVGITRRGFGASSAPAGGYDTATLGADVVHALDALHIQRAVLVGHSLAGDELTWVAVNHPARVQGLVYLDAAYDRVALREAIGKPPERPEPPPAEADLASPVAFADYMRRGLELPIPLGEVLAGFRFGPNGKLEGSTGGQGVAPQIMAAAIRPELAGVAAPTLSFYAVSDPEDPSLTEHRRRLAQFNATQRARFREALPRARVVELRGAKHYLFFSNRDDVVRETRAFLAALPR